MNDLLTKLFVLVPAGTSVTLENLKTESERNKKIYFVEDLKQIVLNGKTYGIDPKTSTEITSLIKVIGGEAGPDGTVTVDFSNLNYYKPEGTKTIIGAIKAIDATIKVEMDKLKASKTLGENYEFSGSIKYVTAKDGVAAHIALCDETDTELSTISVSDIIGNGVLDHSEYVKETGILHLYFKQADDSTRDEQINLAEMLDIDDVLVKSGSENYLEVANTTKTSGYRLIAEPHTEITVEAYNALPEGEKSNYEAINEHGFEIGTKVKKIVGSDESADLTGLADAADVKAYVDSKATDLSVEAQGDAYVYASIDPTNNKKVIIATNKQDVSASAGTRGTWSVSDAGVATLNGETAPSISGVARSLMDGEQAINAIKTYVDAAIAAEAAERVAKISAAVKALDKNATETKGSNVHVTMSEVDGIVSIDSVVEDYATVDRTKTTSTAETPAFDAAISVVDPSKLVIGSDLEKVAAYAADKVTEEKNRVDNLSGSATDTDSGNYISVKVDSTGGKVTGVTVEFDPWEIYG